mmetsp:Transcript_21053/g.65439  ORF Transcript_21053/g.65439 Transcript_21053/m.65439 type:complete len:215 (-) Transcript_21053:1915-2559(-)
MRERSPDRVGAGARGGALRPVAIGAHFVDVDRGAGGFVVLGDVDRIALRISVVGFFVRECLRTQLRVAGRHNGRVNVTFAASGTCDEEQHGALYGLQDGVVDECDNDKRGRRERHRRQQRRAVVRRVARKRARDDLGVVGEHGNDDRRNCDRKGEHLPQHGPRGAEREQLVNAAFWVVVHGVGKLRAGCSCCRRQRVAAVRGERGSVAADGAHA